MVYKGPLNKRDGEINVYLFDHALLFTKMTKNKQHEALRVYRPVRFAQLLCVSFAQRFLAYSSGTSSHYCLGGRH